MNECKLIIKQHIHKNKTNIISYSDMKESEMVNKYNIIHDNLYSKIILSKINSDIENKINTFFNNITNKNKSNWKFLKWLNIKTSITRNYNESLIKILKFTNNENLEQIDEYFINLAITNLTDSGFIVKKEGSIEYRHFNLSNKEHTSIYFDVYKDDELLGFNVETCIFITQNTNLIFGNYDYYIIGNASPQSSNIINSHTKNTILKTNMNNICKSDINTSNINKKKINVTNNIIMLISGNILYCPEPLYGNGIRNYITVRLRTIRI